MRREQTPTGDYLLVETTIEGHAYKAEIPIVGKINEKDKKKILEKFISIAKQEHEKINKIT